MYRTLFFSIILSIGMIIPATGFFANSLNWIMTGSKNFRQLAVTDKPASHLLPYARPDELMISEWYLKVRPLALISGLKKYNGNLQFAPGDDLDGDGIINSIDIDDDNDGIPDEVESPSCFYTALEAIIPLKISTGITSSTVNSVAVISGNDIPTMHDLRTTNLATSNHVIGSNQLPATGTIIYKVEYPTAVGLTEMVVNTANPNWGTGAQAVLEGSMNDASYDTLSVPVSISSGTAKTWPVTLHSTKLYKYYRITVSTVGSTQPAFTNYEVTGTINTATYIPSAHPKAGCSTDTDNDSIFNHMDLDSDGDGCPDSREASVSSNSNAAGFMSASGGISYNGGSLYSGGIAPGTADAYIGDGNPDQYGANGFFNNIETNTETGIYDSIYTYDWFATVKGINFCTDTDGDGITDYADIDDDNDGITDYQEGARCPQDYYDCSYVSNHYKPVTWTTFNTTTNTANGYTIIGRDTVYATYQGTLYSPGQRTGSTFMTNASDYCLKPWINTTDQLPSSHGGINQTHTFTFSKPVVNPLFQAWSFGGGGSMPLKWVSGRPVTLISTNSPYGLNIASDSATIQGIAGNGSVLIHGSSTTFRFVSNMDEPEHIISMAIAFIGRPVQLDGECASLDTDGDGIPNQLDLDSDGDGCSDLKEAGLSPLTDAISPSSINNEGTSYGIAAGSLGGSQLNPAATDANNDGLNDSVDPDLDGQVNYASTYDLYAVASGWNYCSDKEGDGIPDINDIDDDNDGILDATESPSCFYTAAEISIPAAMTTGVPTTGAIANTYDNNTASTFGFAGNSAKKSLTVFEIIPALPLQATALQIEMNSSSQTVFSNTGNSLTMEGWNGTNWITLIPAFTPGVAPNAVSGFFQTFTFTQNETGVYSKFRLQGLAGTVTSNLIREIKLLPSSSYNPSAHPKTSCSSDMDADGIFNYLDLDSDGDGCSDAQETGISGVLLSGNMINNSGLAYSPAAIAQGVYGANGFANALETPSAESGVYSGSYTNYSNATNNTIHTCATMPLLKPDVNVTYVNMAVSGNISTNDITPAGCTYSGAIAVAGYTNPSPATPSINSSTGAYTFTSSIPGIYKFMVQVCPPTVSVNCPSSLLTIGVLESLTETNKPFTAPDFAVTKLNTPIVLKTLANDKSGNNFTTLQPSTVAVSAASKHGTAVVNTTTGDITYTPATGFTGVDTLIYTVCDNASPVPNCNSEYHIITVLPSSANNSIVASDDYLFTPAGASGSGNVLANDFDPEGNTMTVTAQSTTITGVGSFVLAADGSYAFTPESSHNGPFNFPYRVCDNGSPQACTQATLYILVPSNSALPLELLTFVALKENNTATGLHWTTTNEINSSHFVIERMVNGSGQWQTIGTVNTTGNGSTAVNSYYFQDRQPAPGANYYRLKQVDLDGTYKYSAVRLATFGVSSSVLVYPNPAIDYVIITGSNLLPGHIHIYDALGQELGGMVKTEQVSPQEIKLQLYKLTPGMYIIKVNGQAIKIIKK